MHLEMLGYGRVLCEMKTVSYGRGGKLVGLSGLCCAAAGSRLERRLLGCGRAGQSVVVVGAGPGVLLRVFVCPRACFSPFT